MTKILLLLALALPPLTWGADSPPTITIDGGNAVDLCACPNPNIRLSVTAKSLPAGKPGPPIVVEAGLGNMRDSALAVNFTPSWTYDANNIPIALNLAIANPAMLGKAGTYNVVIDPLPGVAGSQKISLQITRPAATLQVPTKLIVRRGPDEAGAGDFSILEQTGKTDLTNLHALSLQPALLGNDPVAGSLDFTFTKPVPAGQIGKVAYRLNGEFPLGTVTGTSQISSAQLSQPVTLNWEVRTARSARWIVLYTLAGSFLSWLLKAFLQARIQLGEARVKADNLIVRVEAELKQRDDEKFRAALQDALAELKSVRDTDQPADIDTARSALDQALRTALTTLATDRQTLVTAIEDLKSVFEIAAVTPPSLAADVTQAKTELQALDLLLRRDNIHAGTLELTEIRGRLGNTLRTHGIEWQQRVARLFDAFVQPSPGISDAIKLNFTPVVQDVKQRVASIKNEIAASTSQEISQLLALASTELGQARDALELLQSKVQAESAQAQQVLNDHQIGNQQDRDDLKRTIDQFAQRLPALAEKPGDAIDALPATLTAIDNAWRKVLPRDPDVQQKLDAQDYLGAANAATGRGQILREEVAAVTEDWTQSLHVLNVAAPAVISRQTIFGFALQAPDEPVEVRTKSQLLMDKSIQSVILFILVAIGSLSMYHAAFVGNLDDFAKIFFWAFGLDITVDAVRTALKPKGS